MDVPTGKTLYVGKHVFKENTTIPVHLEEIVKINLEHTKLPEPEPDPPPEDEFL